MSNFPSKNKSCPCESGKLYKFCCIKFETRKDLLKIPDQPIPIDNFFNNAMAYAAQERIAIKNFCKENECYLFTSFLNIGECNEFGRLLEENTLSVDKITDMYISKIRNLGEENVLQLFSSASTTDNYYSSRINIISDVIKSHFLGFYSVSIPVLFILMESIFRELGQFDTKGKFQPKIKPNNLENKPTYAIKDDINYYNFYINKLFEGSQERNKFNRNTILHGLNINYNSERYSTIMILSLLEISNFLWWDENIKNFKGFNKLI